MRRFAPALAWTSVAIGVVVRIVQRGPYVPGFDLIGAAQGLWVVSTQMWSEIARYYVDHRHAEGTIWNVFSVPFALVPGLLASLWPWEYWPHVVMGVAMAASLALAGRAVGLGRHDSWIIALAFGVSPLLLSWSVAGFAYASCVVPYALALWVVLRWSHRPLVTLALTAVTLELTWHVQELGRTVFTVFLVAAFTLGRAPWSARAIWFVAGAWHVRESLLYPTFNTAHHAVLGLPSLDVAADRIVQAIWRFLTGAMDSPVLLTTGLVSALLVQQHRWFWRGVLLAQLALLGALLMNSGIHQGPDGLWPRRFVLVSFVALATTVAFLHEQRHRTTALLALLVAGNAAQVGHTIWWSRHRWPEPTRGVTYALPYVHAALDYNVPWFTVEWTGAMLDRLDAGEPLLVIHNTSSYDENAANPAGVLERLYLHLGHERYFHQVFAFGDIRTRWNDVPVRPMAEVEEFAEHHAGTSVRTGYLMRHPGDDNPWPEAERVRAEATAVLAAVGRHATISWIDETTDVAGRQLARFTLSRP